MREVEITIVELLKNHPKTLGIITEHFMKVMVESFDHETVPEEFKNVMLQNGISIERLALIIGAAPRCLFDVFDEHEVYIEIYRTQGSSFTFEIEGFKGDPGFYLKRKECEIRAIKESFKLLEENS